MNVDDIRDVEVVPEHEVIKRIFEKQTELAIKYGPIEARNGFYHPPHENKPHIDDAQFQTWLKNMFWRATEEIAEALENPCEVGLTERLARPGWTWRDRWNEEADLRHFFEELADATHFIVEAMIYAQVNWLLADFRWRGVYEQIFNDEAEPTALRCPSTTFEDLKHTYCADVILALGLAANCLKNKPWKSSQMPTDVAKFRAKLLNAWGELVELWIRLGCSLTDVWNLYSKKHAVNVFRQDTQY